MITLWLLHLLIANGISMAEFNYVEPVLAPPPAVVQTVNVPARPSPVAVLPLTAGPNGAWAYCSRGQFAFTPCSTDYFAPGARVSLFRKLVTLVDGFKYWAITISNVEIYVPVSSAS